MKQIILSLLALFAVYALAISTGHDVKLPENDLELSLSFSKEEPSRQQSAEVSYENENIVHNDTIPVGHSSPTDITELSQY